MKKVFVILTINVVIPFILIIILPSILITSRKGVSNQEGTAQVSFTNSTPMQFTITSDLSNLQSLSFDIKNPGIKNNSKIMLDIVSPNSERSMVIYGSNVGDPSTVLFKFPAFSEPPNTTYSIFLTTDNTVHDSLYLLTNSEKQPKFESFYKQSNFLSNIISNLKYQFNQIKNRSIIHSLAYFTLIIILNYKIFIRREA